MLEIAYLKMIIGVKLLNLYDLHKSIMVHKQKNSLRHYADELKKYVNKPKNACYILYNVRI